MELKKILDSQKCKKAVFAKALGISRRYLYRIIEKGDCSRSIALRIEELTDGKVKASGLIKESGNIEKRLCRIEKILKNDDEPKESWVEKFNKLEKRISVIEEMMKK